MKKILVQTKGRVYRIEPSETDNFLTNGLLLRMFFEILIIREFETRLLDLKDKGLVHGPVHSSIGQEGSAIGAIYALDRNDWIGSTHRGHHHFIAKAFRAYLRSYNPLKEVPEEAKKILRKTMAEILGLREGYCQGRGGSMHLADKGCGFLGTNAIVAGGVAAVTGMAWALKMDQKKNIAVSFIGDGVVNQGVVHEVMNMASLWHLPVIFFIENNLYAVATHVKESSCVEHLAERGLGYGMESWIVDGMDPIAVYYASHYGKKLALNGNPIIIEAETYRYKHQAQGLPGSAFGYRSRQEEEEWEKRDPVKLVGEKLVNGGVLEDFQIGILKKKAEEIVAKVAASLISDTGKSQFIPSELYPGKRDLLWGVRSDGKEFKHVQFTDHEFCSFTRNVKYIDVIPEVLAHCLEIDPRGIILGEEVGHMKGGAFLATKGLYQKFPDRVINTPISEAGFCGMALGLSLAGKRPIVEIMYPDFSLVAADQLFNQIAKIRYMYGNQFDVPLIVRTRVGIGTGYGAQHSMDPASLYALFPGWRIIAPSNPFDYIGLFNTAFKSLDPVLVIEHHALYPTEGPVPDYRDYFIPFGKSKIIRQGDSVTVISYSYMTVKVLEAARQLSNEQFSVEVIDLRTVDYAGIDYETIGKSVQKTGRLMIAEEGSFLGGIGAQICDEIQRKYFDYLDAEVYRVAGLPLPMPVSKPLEELVIPGIEDIKEAILQLAT